MTDRLGETDALIAPAAASLNLKTGACGKGVSALALLGKGQEGVIA
jgi:hypothetical protein